MMPVEPKDPAFMGLTELISELHNSPEGRLPGPSKDTTMAEYLEIVRQRVVEKRAAQRPQSRVGAGMSLNIWASHFATPSDWADISLQDHSRTAIGKRAKSVTGHIEVRGLHSSDVFGLLETLHQWLVPLDRIAEAKVLLEDSHIFRNLTWQDVFVEAMDIQRVSS